VTTISIFIIGPVTTSETLNNYFHNNITWKYLNNIRLATKYELPGVFVDNPYPKAVNGSLWTLPVEAKWYLIVALFGLLRVINIKAVLIACFLALSCWLYVGELAAGGKNVDYFWSYGVFFLAGIFLTSYNGVSIKLVLWAVILSLPLIYFGYWFFGTLIALPPFIIYLGEQSNRYLCKISMMGDLSYGVYVFAFPVQQTLFHFFGLSLPFSISLSIVLLVTFTIAYFSWHFVELPSMNLKRYLYPRIATI
jgi:peptidoglycan/LPS O-acetylase OafA/YrhL